MTFSLDKTTNFIYSSEDAHRPRLSEHECYRLLWIKAILRAAYDWVLYRDSKNPITKNIARGAHAWLFETQTIRRKIVVDGKVTIAKVQLFNSLENICGFLDLDIEVVRKFARTLTRDEIKKQEFLERCSSKKRQAAKLPVEE